MGIEKEVELPSMAVAKYHKIDGIPDIKWNEDGTGSIQLALSQFISYEARLAGAKPLSRCFKFLKLDKDLTGIIRFIMYKGVLPLVPEFETSQIAQDGELGSMLRLLTYLDDRDLILLSLAMVDIIKHKNLDNTPYKEWYETHLKDDMLSTLG